MPCIDEGLLVDIKENVTWDAANVSSAARDAGHPALDDNVYIDTFVHFLLPKRPFGGRDRRTPKTRYVSFVYSFMM